METRVKLEGLRELNDVLLRLPLKLRGNAARAALMAGARIIANAAKAEAPQLRVSTKRPQRHRTPGTLAKNIRARSLREAMDGHDSSVIINVRKLNVKAISAFKKKTGKAGALNPSDPYYWRFMEFGYTDRGGTWHNGRKFIRGAFEANKVEAALQIKARMRKRIEAAARELYKPRRLPK